MNALALRKRIDLDMRCFGMKMGILLLFGLLLTQARAQDGGLRPGWRMLCAPVNMLITNPNSLEPLEGVRPLQGADPETQQYDVRDFLKRSGLEIPTDGIAVFQRLTSTLILIAPNETVDLAELFAQNARTAPPPPPVLVTATLAEFETSSFAKIRELPYARLRSVAGKTWKETEEISLKAESGKTAMVSQRFGDQTQRKPNANERASHKGASTSLEAEAIIGPDGYSMDVLYKWHRQWGTGDSAEKLDASSRVITKGGVPTIVARWQINGSSTRGRALVLRSDVILDDKITRQPPLTSRDIRERIKERSNEAKRK